LTGDTEVGEAGDDVNEVIPKPFKIDELEATIQELLRERAEGGGVMGEGKRRTDAFLLRFLSLPFTPHPSPFNPSPPFCQAPRFGLVFGVSPSPAAMRGIEHFDIPGGTRPVPDRRLFPNDAHAGTEPTLLYQAAPQRRRRPGTEHPAPDGRSGEGDEHGRRS